MKKRRRKAKHGILFNIVRFIGKIILMLLKGIWILARFIFKALKIIFIKWPAKKRAGKGRLKMKDDDYESLKEIKRIDGSLNNFESKITRGKSTVGIIIGARGSGKSAIGMRIIENVREKTKKRIYAMGFNPEFLPEWINIADDLNKIENNSFIIIDEGGITFSSRNFMSEMNKLISSILLIARHKDISVIFITQNSSNLEINTIRQADYLILKPHSLLQLDFERDKIRDIYREVEQDFKKFSKIRGLAYIYSSEFRGFISNTLPRFWSENLSKSFRGKSVMKKSKISTSSRTPFRSEP